MPATSSGWRSHRRLAGSGLGSDLVRASLRWARGHGARSMLVNTQMDNVAAASIYRRLGFNDVPGGLLLFKYAPSEREG